MSAALKRRFNFVTIPAIPDIREELAVIQREASRALNDCGIPQRLPEDLAHVLVTVFRELRQAQTADGQALDPMTTAMSTAEAVGVAITAVTHAWYFEQSAPSGAHLLHSLLGTAFKDVPEDRKRLAHYLHLAAKRHQERAWAQLFAAHAALG